MNFVSKFDAGLSFSGVSPKAQTHVETAHTKAPSDAILVQDADLLFNGQFKRTGLDLVIARDDRELLLSDYFKGDKRSPLASSDGAYLTGKIVDALVGHVQTAQADGSASTTKIIGHVTKLNGSATVVRNGVSVILNNGDNVHQGDVVQSGSNSTIGITFIDGSVFGLGSNARMVLNEMVYDPNGSSNSSLISLVQGTISFVAGATAKHGDMKVDTPVATMGIRGTAVLVEIDFEVPGSGVAPPARFQVLVEPDGTTGSFLLLEKATLAPFATVNQAGTVTTVSGSGAVSFLASAQLSPELVKLVTEVFSQKFSDNSNPKSDTHFTDSIVPQSTFPVMLANGETGLATVKVVIAENQVAIQGPPPPQVGSHIPGPPGAVAFNKGLAELTLFTESSQVDSVTAAVSYSDVNVGDVPTVSAKFHHFAYQNEAGENVTATLTDAQKAAITAVSVPLVVTQDPAGKNVGTATLTYSVPDHALDFLAQGEKLTLTYTARVDNNFAPNNEYSFVPVTITITGTNDVPTIVVGETSTGGGVIEDTNLNQAGQITAGGVVSFDDVDLTDTHTAGFVKVSSTSTVHLPGFIDNSTYIGTFTLVPVSEDQLGPESGGTLGWSFALENNNAILQSLAAGQTITQVYKITVDDGHGGTVTQDVTITITGTNDAPNHPPVIVGELTTAVGAVTEDTDVNASQQVAAEGTIVFKDIDLIDAHTASFAEKSSTSNAHLPGFIDGASYIGTFELTPVDEDLTDTDTLGSVGWTFTIDKDNLGLQSLAVNQTVTQVYTVLISDANGGTVAQDVTITINGTNDAPVITSGPQTGAIEELAGEQDSATVDTAYGTVTFTDADLIDTHSVTITGVIATGTTDGLTDYDTQLTWLSLGELTDSTGGIPGSKDWTFSANDYYFDYLAAGEKLTLAYTVEVNDSHGGVVTQQVVITVTGTNDEPVVSAADVTGAVTELVTPVGNLTDAGSLTFTDVDLTDVHLVSATGTPVGTTLGSLTAVKTSDTTGTGAGGQLTWTYTVAASAVEYLAKDETKIEQFTITLDDQNGGLITKTISVTITGTNDAPVVSASDVTGAVTELVTPVGNLTDTGSLTFTDVDLKDVHLVSATGTPVGTTLGTLTAVKNSDTTGTGAGGQLTWTYTVAASAVEYLAKDVTKVEQFTITLDDQNGGLITKTISVTITGTNDAPSIISAASPPKHGVMVVNPISPSTEVAGQSTNTLGLANESFNNKTAGTFYSDALDAQFTASGNAGVLLGSSSDAAAPFIGPLPGGADTSKYLYIAAHATETITFTTAKNAFGLYWGSVDSYNTVNFYNGTTLVASYSGADVSPLLANGDQGSFAANGYVDFVGLPYFDKVVLASSGNSFEIDNISAGVVPTAHALLVGSVSGTMSVHDPDIGDTLTGVVTANASVQYNNSSTLPNGVSVADLIKAGNITFDSVQSDGGTDVLHWSYNPNGAALDFLHAGDVLKLTYTAQVSDGHGITGSQQIVVTLVGTDNETNLSSFKFVDGTSGNDTFNKLGGGVSVNGNGGNDTFVFAPASGSATIADFDSASDTISFASSMFNHNPANVLAATNDDGHGNAVITLNATDTITLQHVLKAQLSPADFHFV